jgi:hypothetical protein
MEMLQQRDASTKSKGARKMAIMRLKPQSTPWCHSAPDSAAVAAELDIVLQRCLGRLFVSLHSAR